MINKKKHPKIFYVPGMISLVLLPLFCLWFFYTNDSFKVYGAVNISLRTDKEIEEIIEETDFINIRKYKLFDFEKSIAQEQRKLLELKMFIRELVKKEDTINGVKIHFGKHSDFDTYIQVLDIMEVEKLSTYLNYKDDFFGLTNKKRIDKFPPIESFTCGYGKANRDYFLQIENEKRFEYLISLYKKHWILFLAYFGIVFQNIFALVKFNKNRK